MGEHTVIHTWPIKLFKSINLSAAILSIHVVCPVPPAYIFHIDMTLSSPLLDQSRWQIVAYLVDC